MGYLDNVEKAKAVGYAKIFDCTVGQANLMPVERETFGRRLRRGRGRDDAPGRPQLRVRAPKLRNATIQRSMAPPPDRTLRSLAGSVGLMLETGANLQVTQKIAVCIYLEELLIIEGEFVRDK